MDTLPRVLGMATLLLMGACGSAPPPPPPPPVAGVYTVRSEPVAVPIELTGRTTSFAVGEVRPQVSGVIEARTFVEGAMVTRGQPLYLIDPGPYRAAVEQARANLASARARVYAARAEAERYRMLTASGAVARQQTVNMEANAREAAAAVAQYRAVLDNAEINLRRTRVPAPISGRISRSYQTVGALATTDQTDPMARIEQLDPIFVDVSQSAAAVLALKRALAVNGVVPSGAEVSLSLPDGSRYDQAGRLEFSEVFVNPNTGTVTLRARFPNAQGTLLPGMYVRAHLSQRTVPNGILVPQTGVTRNPRGIAVVLVLGRENRAELRDVVAETTIGQYWLVTHGLKSGERVIVEGLGNIKPGQVVRPVVAKPMPPLAPPAPSLTQSVTR